MKLLLIKPACYGANGQLVRKRPARRIELTLPLLAALTQSDVEVQLVDETTSDVPFDVVVDLVGITSLTRSIHRAYEIADAFRARNKTVVLGGIHVTFRPAEALAHADAVVIGEAEGLWDQVISDFQKGRLQKTYSSRKLHDLSGLPAPRFDLLSPRNYLLQIFPVQATRGCPHHCEFCSVAEFFHNRVRSRPIDDVLRDVDSARSLGARRHFFVDENIAANPRYAKELFRALAPMKIRWMGQSTVEIAGDPELLELAVQSGCSFLEVGFETIEPRNLELCGKQFNRLQDYARAIRLLRQKRVIVGASLMFGFDHDAESIFDQTLNFLLKNRLPILDAYALTPGPGTRLYERVRQEARITDADWSHYDGEHVTFKPRLMSPEVLEKRFWQLKQDFYSLPRILGRLLQTSLRQLPVVSFVNFDNWLSLWRRAQTSMIATDAIVARSVSL